MAEETKKTAVLVIHGVGPHTSFQACDSFVQGFCSSFTESGGGEQAFDLQHKLKQRQDWLGMGIPWVQNYVSFTVPGTDNEIDFYEYFWDIYMIHRPSFRDAFGMLSNASKSAHTYYKKYGEKNPDLLSKASDLGEFGRRTKFGFGHPEFRPAGYLKLLGPFFGFMSIITPYIPRLLEFLDKWSQSQAPIVKQLFGALSAFIKEPVPDFIGDLVRYLDLDPRSERFEIRRKIMNGAMEELKALLKDDSYNRIMVAGHSLGSVIGYDALNRIIQEVSTEKEAATTGAGNEKMVREKEAMKITGFISFGSPLDKIALFFRQHVKDNKRVQQQVLSHLRGFRSVRLEEDKTPGKEASEMKLKFNITNPIGSEWDNSIRWLNFYHKKDIISGKLDMYNLKGQALKHQEGMSDDAIHKGDGNIEILDDFKLSVAHGCYWGVYLGEKKGTNQMHKTIIEEFFR